MELKRLGKFSNSRKKQQILLLTLPTDYDARIVLAKAQETRTVLTENGVFILPALSKEDAIKENLCFINEENYLRKCSRNKLNIRKLELFNDGKKEDLGDNPKGW